MFTNLIEALENADEDDEEEDGCIDNASTAKPLRIGRTVLDSRSVEDIYFNHPFFSFQVSPFPPLL